MHTDHENDPTSGIPTRARKLTDFTNKVAGKDPKKSDAFWATQPVAEPDRTPCIVRPMTPDLGANHG